MTVLPKKSACKSCSALRYDSVILMEATTGTVIYAKNEHEALPPASVTKIMTLLLVAEAVVPFDGALTVVDVPSDGLVVVSGKVPSGLSGVPLCFLQKSGTLLDLYQPVSVFLHLSVASCPVAVQYVHDCTPSGTVNSLISRSLCKAFIAKFHRRLA